MHYHRYNTRLPPVHYLGPHTCFVTLCCDRRDPHLRPPVFAQLVLDLLHQTAPCLSAGGASEVSPVRKRWVHGR
jgi:hypothetical protein